MRVLGLIVEYNPLHNGHVHHINESKKLVNPDVTIAVMSGHFMQRGEPACTTKWNRAKLALDTGIDLVVELPFAYSNQSADIFAHGAVSILHHLNATHLVFGSESGEIEELTKLADIIDNQNINKDVNKKIKEGFSLPKALAAANPDFKGSNNTLGIQYIRAVRHLKSAMVPLTISREFADYNDIIPTDEKVTSATAIRKMIDKGIDYSQYVPIQIEDAHIRLQNWDTHYKFLRHKLLTSQMEDLNLIHDMVEGIEYRLVDSARTSGNWEEFVSQVKTKRYTRTRIQRICVNVLTGLTKKQIVEWNLRKCAPYIRILGFNKTGSSYLKQIKDDVEIPVYSNFAKKSHPMMQHEIIVTAAWCSVYQPEYITEILKRETAGKPIMKG